MASFYIYCPCKLNEFGLGRIHHGENGNGLMPYIMYGWIKDRDTRAKCVHCGETVKILGDDPSEDRRHGLTKRRVKRMLRRQQKEDAAAHRTLAEGDAAMEGEG